MLVRRKNDTKITDLKVNYHFLLDTWHSMYDPKFLQSEYMQNLMAYLFLAYDDRDINMRPANKADIFKPFRECSLDDCNVIFVTEFPTTTNKGSGLGIGNCLGLTPYSVTKEFAQFQLMIEENLYDSRPLLDFDITLEEAADNGVLFLNTALTCTAENNRAHVKHWEKFIAETITNFDELMMHKAFVFIGEAAKFAPLVNEKYNKVFIEKNSIDFCVQNGEYWNTKIFKELNDFLIDQIGLPYSKFNPVI